MFFAVYQANSSRSACTRKGHGSNLVHARAFHTGYSQAHWGFSDCCFEVDKTFAKTHYEKPAPGDAIIVELDEMWHYLGSKKTSYGSGKLIVEKLESLLTGNVEEGIRVRYRN